MIIPSQFQCLQQFSKFLPDCNNFQENWFFPTSSPRNGIQRTSENFFIKGFITADRQSHYQAGKHSGTTCTSAEPEDGKLTLMLVNGTTSTQLLSLIFYLDMSMHFSRYWPCILDHAEKYQKGSLAESLRFLSPDKIIHPFSDCKKRRNAIYMSGYWGQGVFC